MKMFTSVSVMLITFDAGKTTQEKTFFLGLLHQYQEKKINHAQNLSEYFFHVFFPFPL